MKQHFLFIASLEPREATLVSLENKLVTTHAQRIGLAQRFAEPDEDQISIVLADHLVSNHELTLAARNQAQLSKAARYAVEEKFPGRLEDYHIITHKTSKHKVSVRAIQLARLESLLEHLKAYEISPNALYVESDLLNHSVPTLLLNAHETTLCGRDLEQTYEFDTALVPVIAEKIFASINNSPELRIIYPEDQSLVIEALQNQAPESLRIKKILKNEEYYKSLCGNQRSGINLLQGDFSVEASDNTQGSFWVYPAWLAAASAMVFTGGLFAQNLVLAHRVNQQETKLTESYTNAFPNAKEPRNINDLGIKLRSKLNSASATSSSTLPISALELLNSTALAAAQHPVQLLGLTLDSKTAEILVVGNSIEILDDFKNSLQTEIGNEKTMNMDSVISKDEQYQGKISIR